MLWWRLILEEYSPDIKYIPGNRNIAVGDYSQLPSNGNQQTSHNSSYTMENRSELYDTEEMPYGMFPFSINLIYLYQQDDPILVVKLNCADYRKSSRIGGQNTIEHVVM